MHARLRGPKDMNIKVAAFTVSEKSMNTHNHFLNQSRYTCIRNMSSCQSKRTWNGLLDSHL